MNMREPPVCHACLLTVTGSSSLSFPAASSSKTMYAVISLVRLAGAMRATAFCAAKTLPV